MAATKHSICRARAAAPAVVVGLLLATCLLLAATAADAGSRPLKVSSSSSSSSEGGDAGPLQTVESSPAVGYIIKTEVVGTAEQQDRGAAGHRSMTMSVDMLGGIKPQGPSPGDGH